MLAPASPRGNCVRDGGPAAGAPSSGWAEASGCGGGRHHSPWLLPASRVAAALATLLAGI